MELKKFKKVLVANRGEIAIRVFRALNELGITTVGIYSKEDKYALFRAKADESYPAESGQRTYRCLSWTLIGIINIAKAANVDAIHPGYGFLSENPDFVDACEAEWDYIYRTISKDLMNAMGDKISSKADGN